MRSLLAATALALTLAACSQAPAPVDGDGQSTATATPAASPAPTTPSPTASSAAPAASKAVLTLEGLGDLALGKPVPAGGKWAERGAAASDACATVTSPDFPGVYGLIEGGKVRRVTVGQRSTVKLVEGIGVGAKEAEVRAAFGGFRATPHKYIAAPAKYLTAPNAASGDPALRFEIGEDGKVSQMHVGMAPQLEYVEGCS